MRMKRTHMLAGAVVALLAAGMVPGGSAVAFLTPGLALAQNLGQRVVTGTVVDGASTPVPGATVFLKDLKNKSIRSYASDPHGRFRFTQVDMAEDHELWAEKDAHKSPVKTVSEWDARKEFETELKLK